MDGLGIIQSEYFAVFDRANALDLNKTCLSRLLSWRSCAGDCRVRRMVPAQGALTRRFSAGLLGPVGLDNNEATYLSRLRRHCSYF